MHIICVSISICSMYNERELLLCCVAVSCVYFFICVFYIKRICILCIPDHVCLPPLSTLHGSVKRSLFFSKCCYKTESGNKIVTPEVWKCPGLHRMWPVPRVLVVDIQWYLGRLFWLRDPQLFQNKMQRSSVVSDERFLTSSSIVFRNWKGSHLKFSWKVFAKYT